MAKPLHYDLIEHKTPGWMKTAPPATIKQLRTALAHTPDALKAACLRHPEVARALAQEHAHHRASTLAANRLLAALPALDAFAQAQLSAAIEKKFQRKLDVSTTYLFDAVGYAQRRPAEPEQFVQSLKHHALQNFEGAASKAGGMDVAVPHMRSVILDQQGYRNGPPFENSLDIEPTAFAALCRELDIGGQYQALIDALYFPELASPTEGEPTWQDRFAAQSSVLDALGEVELSALRQSLHLAFLQGHVGKAAYEAVLGSSLETTDASAKALFSFLDLWNIELTGLVLITFSDLPSVVLYNPKSADTPLKEHPSLEALQAEMRDAIQKDVGVIARHIPDAQKTHLLGKVLDHLMPMTFTVKNIYERVAAPQAQLPLVARAFNRPFRAEVLYQNYTRLRDDARFHAVPTLAMDAQTLHARLAYFESAAMNALTLVGFVVPAIGYLLLAGTVLYLGYEVYEGIESWASDERDTAYAYLFDVIENVAIMAALHVAAGTLKGVVGSEPAATVEVPWIEEPHEPEGERLPVETPSFIEELEDIDDGQDRLWNPDLAPYQASERLPADLEADDLGLRHHQGKRWLLLPGSQYLVEQAPATGEYRLQHPANPRRYQPPLRHNGAGAWLLGTDRPLSWSGMALLRRIGHLNAYFDEPTLQRIVAISDIDEGVLRRALVENQQLPALLQDTMARFKLDQDLRASEGGPSTLRAEFEQRYARLDTVRRPEGATLRRRYPRLPAPIIEELLHHADGYTLQALAEGKVEPRLAEEVRVYQQQVRLARAYEGLDLDAVRSWDADRLILHTLGQLAEWPADLVIDLEQTGQLPADSTRIGDPGTQPTAVIVSTNDGYIVLDGSTATNSMQVHDTLYSALAMAIPAAARSTLGGSGVESALALKRVLQQAPLLPRMTLRQLLRMQTVRPGYRSPLALADGRLGYPMGGGAPAGSYIRRPTLLRLITQLGLPRYTPHTALDILGALERRGLNLRQINDHLMNLTRERNELTRYLDEWREALPGPDENAEALDALYSQLMQFWYDHALPSEDSEQPLLRLEQVSLETFPSDLPAFFGARVARLELIAPTYDRSLRITRAGRRLSRLLELFPDLRSLEISLPDAEAAAHFRAPYTLTSATHNLRGLESLSLANQNLTLSETDFDTLHQMPQLRRLTLDGNQISPFCMPDFRELTLDYLSLERMSLQSWPRSLSPRTLARIGEVSLRHNGIRSLPGFLIGNEQFTSAHTVISLEGNDIIEDQLLSILLSHEGPPERIHFDRSAALNEQIRHFTERREQLHDITSSWANASSSTAPLSEVTMAVRNRIGMTLNAFWRRVELGSRSPLRLDNIALEDCPTQLPAFFYPHVRSLSLVRISGTTAQLAELFERFSSVETLILSEHVQPSQALVSAVLRLPQLTYLSLRDMGLLIDDGMLAIFGQLRALTTLELAGNSLGEITQVPATLHNIRRLDLNNMGIRHWPAWVDALLPLDLLDLSENLLTELPEHILSNPDTQAQVTSIALFDNPLSAETIERARRSSATQRRFTFAISPPHDAPGAGHLHHPIPIEAEDQPSLDLWLLGNPAQNEALRDAWQQLEQADDARNLLAFVGRLQQSAPYRNGQTRAAFAERVRVILIKALVGQEERSLFDNIAQEALVQRDTGSQTCHDGVLLILQNLEMLIDNRSLLSANADSERELYQELGRLYRLNRLDEIARGRAADRDETEVRLAYRRGANGPLQLGIPKDDMLFEAVAEVRQEELAQSMEQVRQDERGEDFLEYAMNNQEWGRYLRVTYAPRFNAIEQEYQANVLNLTDRHPDTSIADLAPEFEALERNKTDQERQLIRELTLLAKRHRA